MCTARIVQHVQNISVWNGDVHAGPKQCEIQKADYDATHIDDSECVAASEGVFEKPVERTSPLAIEKPVSPSSSDNGF